MPDYEIDVDRILMMAEATVRKQTRILGEMGFINGIDEVAIQVPNRLALLNLIQHLTAVDGLALTNTATDHVETLPLRTCYSVDYAFITGEALRLDGTHSYRLELMHKTVGVSPLHDVLFEAVAEQSAAWVVHASFKVPTEDEYGVVGHRLRDNSYECVQRCDSTYGRFSYWQPLDIDDDNKSEFVFLKPRVNTRDAL